MALNGTFNVASSSSASANQQQKIPLIDIKEALYGERVKSFTDNQWPWCDPTSCECTASDMSMAGLYWYQNPEKEDAVTKCFACDIEIDVNDFGPETDPWYLHEELCQSCPYIKLGKRKLPKEYKFREIYDIVIKKQLVIKVNKHASFAKALNMKIQALADFENEEVAEK